MGLLKPSIGKVIFTVIFTAFFIQFYKNGFNISIADALDYTMYLENKIILAAAIVVAYLLSGVMIGAFSKKGRTAHNGKFEKKSEKMKESRTDISEEPER